MLGDSQMGGQSHLEKDQCSLSAPFLLNVLCQLGLPKDKGHKGTHPPRTLLWHFSYNFLTSFITAGCKFSAAKNLYVQKGSFISLLVSLTTKYLPAVIGQEFLTGIYCV